MPNPIERMKSKRQSYSKLNHKLRHWSQAPKHLRQMRALHMPSKERREQVSGAEDVEAAAEDGACDAVEPGSVPGYLRAVD